MKQGIHDLLLADATVASLIGSRLYPLVLPENAIFPAVTYQGISSTGTYTLDGPLGLRRTRLQIDCWGRSYAGTQSLAAAIRVVLDGYFGPLSDGSEVFEAECDDVTDGYDPNSRLYRVQMDWILLHSS